MSQDAGDRKSESWKHRTVFPALKFFLGVLVTTTLSIGATLYISEHKKADVQIQYALASSITNPMSDNPNCFVALLLGFGNGRVDLVGSKKLCFTSPSEFSYSPGERRIQKFLITNVGRSTARNFQFLLTTPPTTVNWRVFSSPNTSVSISPGTAAGTYPATVVARVERIVPGEEITLTFVWDNERRDKPGKTRPGESLSASDLTPIVPFATHDDGSAAFTSQVAFAEATERERENFAAVESSYWIRGLTWKSKKPPEISDIHVEMPYSVVDEQGAEVSKGNLRR